MNRPRRAFLHLATGAAALSAVSRIAWAQTYPTRPVRLIVGFAPGGATVLAGSPADFGKLIADETEKSRKVVKFSGAKAD